MKNKKTIFGILLLAGIALVVFLIYRFAPKKEHGLAQAPTEATTLTHKIAAKDTVPLAVEEREGQGEEVPALEEGEDAAGQGEKIQNPPLVANPQEIKVQVQEGQRIQTEFMVLNYGAKAVFLNVYKSDMDESASQIDERIEELINYKKQIMSTEAAKEDLGKASLYTGTPWLLLFPTYAVLEPQASRVFSLTVDAADLEENEYRTNLIILGQSKEESLVLPVIIEVKPGAKIQLSKIEVDDGVSAGTKGNANNIANPGEIVALNVYLENTGNGPAENLALELTADSAPVNILEGKANVPHIGPKGQFSERFLIEVPADSHPTIPPNVILTITDASGRQWSENFYAGDPDKIKYPTGALVKDKKLQEKLMRNIEFEAEENQELLDEGINANNVNN
jgi:hypothetical protein